MRIRNKLVLYLVLLSSFTLLIMAFSAVYNVDSNVIKDAKSKLDAIATIQENRVQSELNNLKTQIAQQTSRTGIINDLVHFNATNDVADIVLLNTRARDIQSLSSDYSDVFILNKDGKTIATSGNLLIEDYFDPGNLEILKNGKTVQISKEIKPSKDIVITGPVVSNGIFQGVVVIVTEAKALKNIMSDHTGLGNTGETAIGYWNKDGNVNYLEQPRFSISNGNTVVNSNKPNTAIVQALLGKETILQNAVDYRNENVHAVTRYISEVDWGLVVKIDKSEVNSPIFRHLTQLLIIIILALLTALALAFLLANSFTKPIKMLKKGTDEIKKGNYLHKVGYKSKNELGQLSEAFDNMTVAVTNSRDEIYQKVTEQTKDIVDKSLKLEAQQTAVLNILEDIEEEKNKVVWLVDDLKKFEMAVAGASDHMVITDPNGIILYANEAVTKITGYKIEDIVGKKAGTKELWGGHMTKEVYKEFWDTIKTKKKPFIGVFDNTRENGIPYEAAATVSPILDDQGKVIYFVGIERDVTKEKEIDKAKTEFVSLASHQLRTPLAAINWYTEYLLTGEPGKVNKEQKECLRSVYTGSQRMVDLVNSLLNVSRLDLGTFEIKPKHVKVCDIIDSVADEMVHSIDANKLNLVKKYSDVTVKANLDPKLFRVIIQNLLSNAIKYTQKTGDITIELIYKPRNLSKTYLIKVTDNGYGIPEHQKDKIFTKMFRADNVQKMDTEGTGLGLYIVKSIIDQSGGSAEFESVENKGSTFTVSWPKEGMKQKTGSKTIE